MKRIIYRILTLIEYRGIPALKEYYRWLVKRVTGRKLRPSEFKDDFGVRTFVIKTCLVPVLCDIIKRAVI